MENFAVKSDSFALYEAFKKDVEKIGWKYCSQFNEFKEHNSRDIDCLYFSNMFIPPYGDICSGVALFSFADSHNWRGAKFSLETQYGEALAFAKAVWEQENRFKFGFSGICSLSSSNTLDVSAMSFPNPCPLFTALCGVNANPIINPTPKFKEGDWVRDITNGEAYKVLSLRVFEGIQSYEIVKGGYIFENILEKWEPKQGEYCAHTDEVGDTLICIYKNKEREVLNYYVGCKTWLSYRLDFYDWCITEWIDRPATPSEIALLDSKLAEQGKRFDKEKCELVDIYKPKFTKGDVVRDVVEGRIGVIDVAARAEREYNVIRLSDTTTIVYQDAYLKKIGNSL